MKTSVELDDVMLSEVRRGRKETDERVNPSFSEGSLGVISKVTTMTGCGERSGRQPYTAA